MSGRELLSVRGRRARGVVGSGFALTFGLG